MFQNRCTMSQYKFVTYHLIFLSTYANFFSNYLKYNNSNNILDEGDSSCFNFNYLDLGLFYT